MAEPRDHQPRATHESHRSRVAIVAGGVILALALVRAMGVQSPLPYWDTDPLTVYTPIAGESGTGLLGVLRASLLGLTPTWSILLDALTLLAAGVAIWSAPRTDGRARTIAAALALLGSIAVAIHATRHGGMSLEHARIGLAWLGAIWGAIGLWCVCADRRARALLAGVLLAFIVVLAAKGLIQILIEHPRTVASFEADKRAFFQSKGWAPESSNAQAYERRLRQREATGWFGLANVLASFAGASLGALAMLFAALSESQRRSKLGFLVVVLITAAMLTIFYSNSKGGVGAFMLGGLGTIVLIKVLPTHFPSLITSARRLGLIACAAIAITLLGVGARGLIGESLGERSILFRWFYMNGASSIIAEEPLLGVGPAGFQSAYALHKPPISPEDVTSPHSILFDFIATLGILGVAFAVLTILSIWRIGENLAPQPQETNRHDPIDADHPPITRHRLYAIASIGATAFFAGLWLERGASMPLVLASAFSSVEPLPVPAILTGLLLTLALVCAWVLLAERLWAMFVTIPDAMSALAVGGLVIAIHAQIEMTPVQPASAALFGAWLAIAASTSRNHPASDDQPPKPRPLQATARWSAAAPILLGVLALTTILPSVVTWESRLVSAARLAAPVGDARTELRGLLRYHPAERGPAIADLARQVSQDLAEPVDSTPRAIEAALDRLALTRGEQAEALLDTAHDPLSGIHPPTLRAQTRLLRRLASEAGDRATSEALLTRALTRAERLADDQPDLAASWSLLGLIHSELGEFSDEHLPLAREAWEREMTLDPHSLTTAVRLMNLCERLDDRPSAAAWARRALKINHNMRLDPLRQLDGRMKARAERIAANP